MASASARIAGLFPGYHDPGTESPLRPVSQALNPRSFLKRTISAIIAQQVVSAETASAK